jgi:mediator of RNA polymerase II transcription subunit 14
MRVDSFCQSLQLEVLYSQSQRLIGQRLRDHIHVEEYISSKKLVLSYWRNQQKKTTKPAAHSKF